MMAAATRTTAERAIQVFFMASPRVRLGPGNSFDHSSGRGASSQAIFWVARPARRIKSTRMATATPQMDEAQAAQLAADRAWKPRANQWAIAITVTLAT